MDKTYTDIPNRLSKLHDELVAAALPPTLLEGDSDGASVGTWVHIVAPGAVAPVDAVVAAHDATTPSPTEVQGAADRANVKALHQLVANMVPRLDQIQTDMAALENSAPPANVNLATIQAMAKATRDEAQAIGDLAQGAERTLKALDSIIRNLYGAQP